MAKNEQGFLGDFSGKLGKAVGSKWRDKAYLRAKASSRKNNASEKQLVQQTRFALGRSFARAMRNVYTLGFKDQAKGMIAANYGMSLLMNNAISDTAPFAIDYSKVAISQGSLPNDDEVLVSSDTTGVIQFAWQYNADDQETSSTDQAIVVAYCPKKNAQCF